MMSEKNPEPNTVITNGRDFISEVDKPPARYRVTIHGETSWFENGSDAAAAVDSLEHGHWSIFDEWAVRYVSISKAICGFPRMNAPVTRTRENCADCGVEVWEVQLEGRNLCRVCRDKRVGELEGGR